MKQYIILLGTICVLPFFLSAQTQSAHTNLIFSVKSNDDVHCHKVVRDRDLYTQGWDTLQQVTFWNEVATLDPEYVVIYSMNSREILGYAEQKAWNKMSPAQKTAFKEQRRSEYGIPKNHTLAVTNGRKDFYLFQETIPNISKGIEIFIAEHTDPWYAQTVLLIESPGTHIKTSYTGARGAFQLMPETARDMGLVVTEQLDERVNFKKSAQAAARLFRNTCVPQAKLMLKKRGISFKETDLWFRLLVMHCYHAGPGNVAAALNAINPKSGGMWLIQRLWKTNAGGFQNESQNYSQIALSAILELTRIVDEQGDILCEEMELGW